MPLFMRSSVFQQDWFPKTKLPQFVVSAGRVPCMALLGCLLTCIGCARPTENLPVSTGAATTSTSSSAPAAVPKVTLLLNWFPEAEHGGFYAAQVHGYFQEEGVEVVIQAGGPKAPVVQGVASGQVQFGVDNADTLLLGRSQQADVVALMAPIQDSPRCIMVHASSGIDTFEKLAADPSVKLAMNTGQAFADYLKHRLPLDKHTVVRYPGNVAQFLADPQFAQQAYSFSEPFVAKQQGGDPVNLMVSDVGFNTYTSVLICSRSYLTEQPDVVGKVVRASRKGWIKYLAEPAETNAYIHSINPEMDLPILEFGVEQLRSLCQPKGLPTEKIGDMTAERWTKLAEQLADIGSLGSTPLNPAEAYTTEFLTEEVAPVPPQ